MEPGAGAPGLAVGGGRPGQPLLLHGGTSGFERPGRVPRVYGQILRELRRYDGFFGPGAGTFLTLAFTGLCRFDLLTAAGNTKVANATSNLASLVTFALGGKVLWAVGIPAALFGIAGGYVGAGLALKGGAKVIRPMFFVVLTLLVVRLVWDLLA